MQGQTASITIVVGPGDTATAFGSGDVEVLATPRIVALVEGAAVAAIRGLLPAESTSVGTRIDLKHVAPSPIGSEVTAGATVLSVQGRKIHFAVEARMDGDIVATGSHDRAIVARADFQG